MQTIRKRLSILFLICSIGAILLITLFVNVTINNIFDQYMENAQSKRYERIVSYFQEVYRREGKWTHDSGIELMHEAYMSSYCLTLMDSNKKVLWGMDPNDIKFKLHLSNMPVNERGVYTSRTFEIKYGDKVVGYVDVGQYSPVLLSEEDLNFQISINKSIVLSGILTFGIVIIISLYFSKQFSAPIKEVSDMSVNLSKGDFNTKSSSKIDIEELENLRESVNILAQKLKYQDELRRRLVSDISHEIRAPLNVLQNNLEAMIDGVLPVTEERLSSLNEEVVRFGGLLINLDVLKEFESEGVKLSLETIFLDELIQDVCEDFHMAFENKNIKLDYNREPGKAYTIIGDKDKLKQVFINLVSNALKFTHKGGNVSINLFTEDKKIAVEVKDNGIGIKEEDLPYIFERLYRGDKSRHQTEGGGIGLTIVKNILQLHYASIDIKSEEGKGTVFKVCFNKNRDSI